MKIRGALVLGALAALLVAVGAVWFASGWWGSAKIGEDTSFTVPSGSTLTSVANRLEEEGIIASADAFRYILDSFNVASGPFGLFAKIGHRVIARLRARFALGCHSLIG